MSEARAPVQDTAERLEMAESEYRNAVRQLAIAIRKLNAAHSAHWLAHWNIQK